MQEKEQLLESNKKMLEHDSKVMRDVLDKHEKVRERAIKYTYQLIAAIGLVAGLGFTGLSSVKSIFMFIAGELFLISGMGVGMRFAKKAFLDEASLYAEYIDKLNQAMKDRMGILPDTPIDEIKSSLSRVINFELKIFDKDLKPIRSELFLNTIFYLFLIGSCILLSSFID